MSYRSGDYDDLLTYPDGRVVVLIGDVSGKGLGAALLMSNLQACARVVFEDPEPLAVKVERLNRSIAANCPRMLLSHYLRSWIRTAVSWCIAMLDTTGQYSFTLTIE